MSDGLAGMIEGELGKARPRLDLGGAMGATLSLFATKAATAAVSAAVIGGRDTAAAF